MCWRYIFKWSDTWNVFHVVCQYPIERPDVSVTKISNRAIPSYNLLSEITDHYIAIFLGICKALMHTYSPFPLCHVVASSVDFGWYALTNTASSFGSVKIHVSLCFWASSVPKLPSQGGGGSFPCCREGTKAWLTHSMLGEVVGGVV